MIRELNRAVVTEQILYNLAVILLACILFRFISVRYLWIYIAATVLLSAPVKKLFQRAYYQKLTAGSHS